MRLQISIIALSTILFGLGQAQTTSLKPSAFSAADKSFETEDYETQAQTHPGYRPRLYEYSNEEEQSAEEQPSYQTRRQQQPQQPYSSAQNDKKRQQLEEELEAEEEPDKLSVLLQKSNFNCHTKTTGYYADETLGCEVFHYCQDNQRHSWICPEGFTFHQVHLICMPPSGENICEESSKYHVVNEYLYKPINAEEHEAKPNVTLKYSERYYPESFYHDERQNYEEDRVQTHNRQPIQVGFQQQQRKTPIVTSPAPIPYRFATQSPQQTVYRSPEEINISLQQRRPQIFLAPSTPKYNDDEYSYEN